MADKQEPLTILVVDDVPENISLLEAFLASEYTIRTSTRGSEAFEIARTTLPDLILMDVMMPGMNGYEVCKALKADATTQKIPVIFVTALLNPGDELRGFEAGGIDYITKPVIGAVVSSRVKAHLALKKSQDYIEEWNCNLKKRLMQSLTTIRKEAVEQMPTEGLHGHMQSVELLSGIFELMETRFSVRALAVSELVGNAARQMGLSTEEIAKIRLAGLLHDIGTLGARQSVPEKVEIEMNCNELLEFKNHPVRGQELFSSLTDLQDVGLMVRGHHENFNGSGFPDGLKDDDIPLGARLVAIADVIEHSASSISDQRDEYALMTIKRQAGTILDPRLILYFTMITRKLYFKKRKSGINGEIEVPPNDLISGMQLSRDLSNEAGVLLLQKGDKLDSARIDLIRRTSRLNKSSKSGVWLYIGAMEQ